MTGEKKTPPPTTTFYIYTTTDGGATLDGVGAEVARAATDALGLFFARPENEAAAGVFVAISENSRKLKTRNVQTSISATLADFTPADDEAEAKPLPDVES